MGNIGIRVIPGPINMPNQPQQQPQPQNNNNMPPPNLQQSQRPQPQQGQNNPNIPNVQPSNFNNALEQL